MPRNPVTGANHPPTGAYDFVHRYERSFPLFGSLEQPGIGPVREQARRKEIEDLQEKKQKSEEMSCGRLARGVQTY